MIIHYSLPDGKTATFETQSDTVILGRNPCADSPVDLAFDTDEYISHHHARLTFEQNHFWVEDLNSANGTWVNGVLVARKTRVIEEDRIRVGWTRLNVKTGPVAVSEEADAAEEFATSIRDTENEAVEIKQLAANADGATGVEAPFALPEDQAADERAAAVALDGTSDQPRAAPHITPAAGGESRGLATEPEPVQAPIDRVETVERPKMQPVVDTCTEEDRSTRPYVVPPVAKPAQAPLPEQGPLEALSELSALIGGAESLAVLMPGLEEKLPQIIPNATRGAVLLPDERGKLLLKAHWPQGEHSVSMTWVKQAFDNQKAFLWSIPEEEATAAATPHSAYFYKVQSAIYVPLAAGQEVLGVMYVDNHLIREAFSQADLELMKVLAAQVAQCIKLRVLDREDTRETDMRSVFLRQFPPKVAERLAGKYSHEKIGGEKVDPVTILVSDVRNFTALSAEMDPDAVVRMINEMFDALVPIVFEFDGVVDKFVGDSVLAVFGSPEPDDQQWEKAVRAALEMQNAIRMLGEGRRARRLPEFEIGISVHSGEVIHGFIGSQQRTEYTIIGDAVNKASRFCDGAGPGEIIISEPVFEQGFGFVDVVPKSIKTKHADVEPDLKAYVVKGIRDMGS